MDLRRQGGGAARRGSRGSPRALSSRSLSALSTRTPGRGNRWAARWALGGAGAQARRLAIFCMSRFSWASIAALSSSICARAIIARWFTVSPRSAWFDSRRDACAQAQQRAAGAGAGRGAAARGAARTDLSASISMVELPPLSILILIFMALFVGACAVWCLSNAKELARLAGAAAALLSLLQIYLAKRGRDSVAVDFLARDLI